MLNSNAQDSNLVKVKFAKVLLILMFSFVTVGRVKAEMDPRAKALGAMALYGTVGGALLGTASLAFGTEGRSIAKGASLGLYAGIIFGSYVVISHAYKKHQRENPQPKDNYYPGVQSPYEKLDGQGGYGEEGEPQGMYWQPQVEMQLQALREQEGGYEWSFKSKKTPLEFFVPLLNISF